VVVGEQVRLALGGLVAHRERGAGEVAGPNPEHAGQDRRRDRLGVEDAGQFLLQPFGAVVQRRGAFLLGGEDGGQVRVGAVHPVQPPRQQARDQHEHQHQREHQQPAAAGRRALGLFHHRVRVLRRLPGRRSRVPDVLHAALTGAPLEVQHAAFSGVPLGLEHALLAGVPERVRTVLPGARREEIRSAVLGRRLLEGAIRVMR
jgi:hypothetical protein